MKTTTMCAREAATYEVTKRKCMYLISYHTLCTGKTEICKKKSRNKGWEILHCIISIMKLYLQASTTSLRNERCINNYIKECNV